MPFMKVIRVLDGEEALRAYGIHECQKATALNQSWRLIEPEVTLLNRDGSHIFTVYVQCGVCGDIQDPQERGGS